MDGKSRPDLYSYIDINLYLKDIFGYLKQTRGAFSYDSWASELGFSNKSYLRFAILGQRGISLDLIERLAVFLALDSSEKEYLNVLLLYSKCEDEAQRKVLGKRLTALLRLNNDLSEVAAPFSTPILADPRTLVVRNILSFADVPRTPAFLEKILGWGSETILGILRVLEVQGLIKQEGHEWVATTAVLKFPDQSAGETIPYHKLCLLKAIEAHEQPVHERHYRSLNLAMSQKEYEEYLKDLSQFARDIFLKFNSSNLTERRIYQINFNLFPWTPTVTESNESLAPASI